MANKPNNPALWSRAKSMAKQKFDVYPSAYANGWAAKWYKGKGGTWRKAEYGMEVMGNGGTPDNPGFNALPPEVQQKIMDNMAQGGEKMPPEIARARFAAAGNLDQMGDYGYAYGGYIPEMMYGGRKQYMQEGGEKEQIMQLIQMYAQMNQIDPADLMQELQQLPPEEQQQVIQQMAQTLQQSQQQPDMTQAAMAFGGYTTGIFAEGGEPNGGMALGQMSAVSDKMNKLRQFVSPEQNLDPWIASKLAVMDHSADAISDYIMYNTEDSDEGEEMEEEEGLMPEMGNGGYTVTRSNDRKGKTHKVTGPDGTVKYFGDSKLGQHPKDPERKAAFYARHKKNLENNPFFRAFARKTWKEGGSTFSGNAWYQTGGEKEPQIEDYLDYGSYRADLLRYNSGQMDSQPQDAPMQEQRKVMWHPEWEEQGIDPEAEYAAQMAAPVVNGTVPIVSSSATPTAASQTPAPTPARSIDYSGVSIVDLLSSVGKASDYNSRKQLAAQLGIDNYYGSAKQNLELIKKVTSNPDVLNDYKPVSSPRSSSSPRRQQAASSSSSSSSPAQGAPATQLPAVNNSALNAIFAQQKKAYLAANPGMTEEQYNEVMMKRAAPQTFIGPASTPLPYSSSEEYDDSYMLNKIANDPESPANIRTKKQKEFARNLGLAALTAIPFASWTRYYPLLRGLPQFANAASKGAKALPGATRLLPQGAKALPKPGPTNWVSGSGLSFEMGGQFGMEEFKQGGGIKLDPAKKGTFKAQAKKMGMSVQEAASSILNAPEGRYTPAMRKKANFAKNFAKQMGGPVEGEVLDVSPEQLEVLRQQGYQFEIM